MVVVVREDLARDLERFARRQHVWAVRTPETEEVARRLWSNPRLTRPDPLATGLTLFNPDATPEDSLLSILDTVEEHHGEYSHDPPVSIIEVVGAGLSQTVREAFATLGFSQFEASGCGFVATRPAAA